MSKYEIRINEKEFNDFKENFDDYVRKGACQLDAVRRSFIMGFANARETLDSVNEQDREKAELRYYITFISLLRNPKFIPRISESELEQLQAKTFEDYLIAINAWAQEIKKKETGFNSIAHRYAKYPKIFLYPLFVTGVTTMLYNGLLLMNGVDRGSTIAFFVCGVGLSFHTGRGIYLKLTKSV